MKGTIVRFLIACLAVEIQLFGEGCAQECPTACTCSTRTDDVTSAQTNLSCSVLPPSIPWNTTTLTVVNTTVPELDVGSFNAFKNLQNLFLDNLAMSSLNNRGTKGHELMALKTLHLNNNKFLRLTMDAFAWCPNVRELKMASNGLKKFHEDVFANLKHLVVLDLANNNLQTLNFRLPSSLATLDLSNNQIGDSAMATGPLPKLAHLKLCGNQFSSTESLESIDMPNVETLCIGDSLSYIHMMTATPIIRELELVGKSALDPDFLAGIKVLRHLQVLTLSFFQVLHMRPQLFQGLDELTALHLNNVVTVDGGLIEPNALHSLSKLQILDFQGSPELAGSVLENVSLPSTVRTVSLRETKMTTFDPNILKNALRHQIFVDLSQNPLNCNEALQNLVFAVLRASILLIRSEETVCAQPESFHSVSMLDKRALTHIFNSNMNYTSPGGAEKRSSSTLLSKAIRDFMKNTGITTEFLFFASAALATTTVALMVVVIAMTIHRCSRSWRQKRKGREDSESFVRAENEYTFDNFTLAETITECHKAHNSQDNNTLKKSWRTS